MEYLNTRKRPCVRPNFWEHCFPHFKTASIILVQHNLREISLVKRRVGAPSFDAKSSAG